MTIPAGVTEIGVEAFKGCTGLTIHVPAGFYGKAVETFQRWVRF